MAFLLLLTTVLLKNTRTHTYWYEHWTYTRFSSGYSTLNLSLTVPMTANAADALAFLSRKWMFAVAPFALLTVCVFGFKFSFRTSTLPASAVAVAAAAAVFLDNNVLFLFFSVLIFVYYIYTNIFWYIRSVELTTMVLYWLEQFSACCPCIHIDTHIFCAASCFSLFILKKKKPFFFVSKKLNYVFTY